MPLTRTFAVASLLCLTLVGRVDAQSYSVVADFGEPEGMQPLAGLTQGTDGFLYGTTAGGGTSYGTIFKVSPNGVLTTLHVFNNSDGARPEAALVRASDGNFYGTTRMGGANAKGVIFKLNPAGDGTLTVVRSFNGNDGAEPRGGLVQASDGNLYGMTYSGGITACLTSCGTVYRISPNGALTTLLKFNKSNGGLPLGGLTVGPDGRLYGTTSKGGANDRGTVFAITLAGVHKVLHSFNMTDGFMPNAGLVTAADGYLYGTTNLGGLLFKGTIFRISTNGAFAVRHSFAGLNGANPRGDLVKGADGRLYGTTYAGGLTNQGTIYRVESSGAVTTLRVLTNNDGTGPYSKLVEFSGAFYGTTSALGPAGSAGTIFKVTANGAYSVVRSLKGSPAKPYAGLTQGTDGVLRGTTYVGGGFNKGTIFSVDDGVVSLVHAFSGTDGANPIGGLTQAGGTLYGATTSGGASLAGSVFKSTGTLTSSLFSLASSNGYNSYGTLVQAQNGNLYGTTYLGGAKNAGTIFRITPLGVYGVVHHFAAGQGGGNPYSGLVVGPGDVLYGTTVTGGTKNLGTIYSFDPSSGAFDVVASFTGPNGSGPRAQLLHASDGRLYGTTLNGGSSGRGTIFRVDPSTGALTTLFSFNGGNGSNPYAGLIEGAAGLMYGTTYVGGASNVGSVFQFDPEARTLQTLHSFKKTTGAYPHGGVVQTNDLSLYGTTTGGGSSGNGVVFRIALN